MRPITKQIVEEVAAEHSVQLRELLGDCRKPRVYRARVDAAHRLRALGLSSTQIGRVFKKDHTTILFYLGRLPQQPTTQKKLRWRKPVIKHLQWLGIERLKPPEKPRKFYLVPYAGADVRTYEWKERRCG